MSTERRQLLEESYKLQTFERDCDETKGWINEKLKTASDENYLVSILQKKTIFYMLKESGFQCYLLLISF